MSDLILTDQNFLTEVIKSQKPVLVDFWAEWCVPCRMIAPILREIAKEFDGKIKIGKLNVDENPLAAATFSIDAIPTLFLFKNGRIVQKFRGVQAKQVIEEAIRSATKE